MRITAKNIADWAATTPARHELPRLIRRLIHRTGTITQISVSAGDSVGQPGWDGDLFSEAGSAWVPKGSSKWEMSCRADCSTKADEDYSKRTSQTSENIRQVTTYVCVTARLWPAKAKWRADRLSEDHWAEVRVYDADDLEQWIEESPGVALQFGEELGLSGPGVESPAKYWLDWSRQSAFAILPEAFFIGREAIKDKLLDHFKQRLATPQPSLYAVRADSVEEACAFVCATNLSDSDLPSISAVVTTVDGWHFIEKNVEIHIAIAARPELAERAIRRDGLTTIVPYAAGDMIGHLRSKDNDNAGVIIDRPDVREFESALVKLGIDGGDAERLATTTGRSWSVFRRRHAVNPSIRRPGWLDFSQSRSLAILCLLGGWSSKHSADQEIVAEVGSIPYEEVERDLRYLSTLDDAPVIEIGDAWKAKSALELLDLFGERITRNELDRFFDIASRILTSDDPQLDLAEEERYAAQIHGKVRPQSGLLINSICDTLIKLAVRGPQVPKLAAANIESRVTWLVRKIFENASSNRWLSLSSLLPALAEAAPNAFLDCVEASLLEPEQPVLQLLKETSGSGMFGRCWHAGLLWALETLAWAPQRLARVATILAKLSYVEIKGNWGNTPRASLLSLFRSWMPQTAAPLDQRIAVLDVLIERSPDASFKLLDDLTMIGSDVATPASRPKWRDDDSGAGRGATGEERHGMLVASADRMIALSKGAPDRIARLITKIDDFDPPRIGKVLDLAREIAQLEGGDEAKETVRSALRHHIYWHRNYDKVRGAALDRKLQRVESIYEDLAPRNLITRHGWLFGLSWPDLPIQMRDEVRDRSDVIYRYRLTALREIYESQGICGVDELIEKGGDPFIVGFHFTRLDPKPEIYIGYAVHLLEKFGVVTSPQTLAGVLRALSQIEQISALNEILGHARKNQWSTSKIVDALVAASEDRSTWSLVDSLGPEIDESYWKQCRASFWFRDEREKSDFAVRKLLTVGRTRSAFEVCRFDFGSISPSLVADILEGLIAGDEIDGPKLDSYRICEAIDYLEKSHALDRDRLIRIEFGLVPALGHRGVYRAAALVEAVTSDPKLFTDLLCAIYKPRHGEREEHITDSMRAVGEIAWRLLHDCRRQPGTLPDGSIDHGRFVAFVDESRDLAKKADRLEACDSTLGQIIAHAPSDADGTWPCEAARDVLERTEMQDLRRGFAIGVRNSRGVTSRAYDEGGKQERKLADMYRERAKRLENSHPVVSALISSLADEYEREGLSEDLEARLRREGR